MPTTDKTTTTTPPGVTAPKAPGVQPQTVTPPATKESALPAKAAKRAPLKPTTAAKAPTMAKPATKPARKPADKPAAKPVMKAASAKPAKERKPKMVRDSFTFPKAEYAVLDTLKTRAAKLGSPVKKTELLRAGVKAIAAMQDAAFLVALNAVPSLKTGRPAKAKTKVD